jgi:ABC-type molybdenum transport system ATPase subunit/photorepair protein PhrA
VASNSRRRRSSARAPSPGSRILVRLQRADVYLEGRAVLRGICVAIRPGNFWVVHGGNGAGKTTLLRTLYGDHGVAVGGRIERAGIGPGIALAEFRRRTGLSAPHLHASYPRRYTVAEVVTSGLHASVGMPAVATKLERDRAARLMKSLKVAHWAKRSFGELSHGQARLVLFARALIGRPRLLLLDEPFDGIDTTTRALLQRALQESSAHGAAIAVAAHSVAEWSHLATHELELSSGRQVYAGPIRLATTAAR